MTIDWSYHLFALVPSKLRLGKRMSWLTVLLKGLQDIHDEFLLWRDDVNRRATFNGQVMVLERMLNLTYFTEDIWASPVDVTASGHIYIEQVAGTVENTAIWYLSEGQATVQVWGYLSEGISGVPSWYLSEQTSSVSFNVMVPVALVFNEPEMRARIDKYVIAGFNYNIVTY